jgi:hypothetical protein
MVWFCVQVGNSQKFTTSGSITLTAHLMGTDAEGRWRVEFHVIDTGTAPFSFLCRWTDRFNGSGLS